MLRTLGCLLVVICMNGCQKAPELIHLSGKAQGTSWNVTYWTAKNDINAPQLKAAIDAEFSRIDSVMSIYQDDSVLSMFNQQQSTEFLNVGQELSYLIEQARIVSKASQGCYDLTVKPLFDLWGFKADSFYKPSDTEIEQTLRTMGMQHIVTADLSARKLVPQLYVDVNSIAQGYSAERMASIVQQAGVSNYLVEIGGELITQGFKPDNSAWRIAIERPLPGAQQLHKILSIITNSKTSVVSSGTYRHYFDDSGKRFSHILDARTGRPVQHDTVSVTVVHPDATQADAWSTALLCLGYKDGVAIAEQHNIAALFISQQGDELHEHSSPQWQQSTLFKEVK